MSSTKELCIMQYSVERKFLKLVGATIRTFDANRNLVAIAEAKAFKLKEQIYFFSDEAKTNAIFSIKARKVLDISATYDIFDPNGTVIASLRRKGMSSTFVRDHWLILDASENQIGEIVEDSNVLGALRRYIDMIALFIPQKFHITYGTEEIGTMQQNKNPFTVKLDCNYRPEVAQKLGSILPVAIPSMIAFIEARQS